MVAMWWIQATHRLRALMRQRREEGQGLVEYALILAFVALVVFVVLKLVSPNINGTLNNVANSL